MTPKSSSSKLLVREDEPLSGRNISGCEGSHVPGGLCSQALETTGLVGICPLQPWGLTLCPSARWLEH